MKRKIVKKLLAGMLVASLCVTQVPYGAMDGANVVYAKASNLLTNGSFEEKLGAEWKLQCKAEGKNVSGSIVPYGVYEGTNSFEISNKDEWVSEYQAPEVWLTQSLEHLPKGTYQLTIHGMGNGGSGAKAVVSGNAIDEDSISFIGWTENKEDWGTITHTFTLDEEVNEFEIGVCIPSVYANGTYYIDDISLVAVTSDNPSEDELTTAKKGLQTLIDECMLLDDEIYTAETWTSFNTALNNAKAELENAGATIEKINTVTQSLTSAKDALVVADDIYYEECYKEDFSNAQEPGWISTWSVSSNNIADKIYVEDDTHTDNKVWNLWTKIEQKVSSKKTISGLAAGTYRLSFVTVGDTKGAKVSASNMVDRPVKVNSWASDNSTYMKTVVNGITVNETGSLEITLDIDFWANGYCKIDDITLEKVVTLEEKISAEKTKLNTLLTECEGLSESLYTAETWSALQTSITAAKASVAKTENSDAVLTEIQGAMVNLTNAKAALELKEKTFYLDIYSENYSDTTDTGWTSNWENTEVEITDAVKESEWKLWSKTAQSATFTKTFKGLEAGDYQFEFLATGAKMGNCTVKVGEISKAVTVNPWGQSVATVVDGVKLNTAGDLTVTLEFAFNDGGWVNLDDVKLLKVVDEATKRTEEKKRLDASISECEALDAADYTEETWSVLQEKLTAAKDVSAKTTSTIDEIMKAKTELLKAKKALKEVKNIFVQKIENLSEDFIRGIDISSYISVTDSGATFKDANGKVLKDSDFFKMLNDSGVNYARIRVWNDPFDKDRNGYGGGNNDLKKAKIIGKLATDAGMKVLIDFHYSDWWADPDRQLEPKAWKGKTVEEKETLLYDYTKESLTELLAYDVDVAMVQVGNETNNGIAGVKGWDNMCKLFSAGSKAVREIANEKKKDIQVAVHFTDPQTKNWYNQVAKELDSHNVDYDVFASSYYPDIHGTMENITNVLQKVATDYNKKVMVAETAWSWTTKDGDGNNSGFNPGKSVDYAVSVQGQINELRDVMDAVNKISNNAGIGVFYWEPAWIPVQYAYDEDGKKVDSIVKSNQEKWEKFGSGWASSYSQEYDPEHGKYYGGSVKDDQAFFDFEGNPLASLTTFKDVYTGVEGTKVILETVKDTTAEVRLETTNVASETDKIKAVLPKTVTGVYNNSTKKELPVVWEEEQVAKINAFGNFSISGVATCDANRTEKVTCSLTILPNTILENSDFENGNANWKVEDAGKADIKWDDTPLRGEGAMHFWSSTPLDFTISQTIKVEKAGKYVASMQLQGGAGSEEDDISIKVVNKTRGTNVKKNALLKGWCNWQNPCTDVINVYAGDELEVIVSVKAAKGAWGSVDDVFLYKIGDLDNNNGGGSSGGNNSGSTSGGSSTPSNPTTDTKPDSKPDNTTETKPDGTTVETATETKPDGTKVETVTETATDGSKKETVVETKPDGTKVETITETAADGSKVETKNETEKNSAGKQVEVATVTKTDAAGKVTSIVEKSTISDVAENTTAKVTVKKNGEGAVTSATASVAATIDGKKTTLSADVVSQLKEAAGQSDIRVSLTAKNAEGKTLYTVKVEAEDLTAGNILSIFKIDSKTGELVMVNSKSYKVNKDGNLDISIKNKATYELVSKEEAKAIEKQVKATIKVQNSSKDVKKGKTTKVAFDKKMNMNNVKAITYSTANKKVATVSKSGKVTAKAKGTVKVKAKVTLKNGSTKTVTMKIKVK